MTKREILKNRTLTPELEKLLVERYNAGGKAAALAEEFGIVKVSVYNILRRHGSGPRGKLNSLTVEEEDEVVRRYLAGESVYSIAKDVTKVHLVTLHNVIKRRGTPMNPEHAPAPRVSTEDRAAIVGLLTDKTKVGSDRSSTAAVAQFGITQQTVLKIAKQEGVVMPGRGQTRTHTLDESVFDVLNEESLYWSGFLHSDGCVHDDKHGQTRLCIGLAEKDYGHLVKLRDFLKSTHKISYVDNSGGYGNGAAVFYSVRSNRLCAALASRGFVTKRTRVPNEELASSSSFWRGAVDGDGWIGSCGKIGKNTYASIGLSGQKITVEAFGRFLKSRNLVSLNVSPTTSGVWQIGTTGSTAEDIIKCLYSNAVVAALDRKRARAKLIMSGEIARFPAYIDEPCVLRNFVPPADEDEENE